MTTHRCAVDSCANLPDDELIVALSGSVSIETVCSTHGEAIRDGSMTARALRPSTSAERISLELFPTG